MFSPYYARARRRTTGETADPLDHCAINVALYSDTAGAGRWAMTERGRAGVQRDARSLQIGPSAMHWDGDTLVIRIDEICVPLPSRLRGEVRVHPQALATTSYPLDPRELHRWRPFAPCARVEVALHHPSLRWKGAGYVDSNAGSRPLEADFTAWDWSRGTLSKGRTVVLYDLQRRDAEAQSLGLALAFDPTGRVEPFEPPARASLPLTGWRMPRVIRSTAPDTARVLRSLEDAPFYSRSLVETQLFGERTTAMHESLSLKRFVTPWCQWMLPFRMPRRSR